MDPAAIDVRLAGKLGDSAGELYLPAERLEGMLSALREYSIYRPSLRRMGHGVLAAAVAVGSQSLAIIGSMWAPGDTITIDVAWPGSAESATVLTVLPQDPTSATAGGLPSEAVILGLAAPTTLLHRAGALIVNGVTGLRISAGVDTYGLPLDFLGVDQDSMDTAVGARATIRRTNAFYDAAYGISEAMSGTGYGMRQQYGSVLRPNYVSMPQNGQAMVAGGSNSGETVWRFSISRPPLLTIQPAPMQTAVLDPLYYRGIHTPASVPPLDEDAILAYAAYATIMAHAAARSAELDYTEGDTTENPSRNASGCNTVAQAFLAEFKRKVARPVCVSG